MFETSKIEEKKEGIQSENSESAEEVERRRIVDELRELLNSVDLWDEKYGSVFKEGKFPRAIVADQRPEGSRTVAARSEQDPLYGVRNMVRMIQTAEKMGNAETASELRERLKRKLGRLFETNQVPSAELLLNIFKE